MKIASFNNLEDLFKALPSIIAESMEDVAPKIKEVESKHVQSDVFDKYDPYVYQRRENGGLDDVTNMPHKVYANRDIIKLEIENTTRGSDDTSFYIAGLVEYGHQNGYGEYDYDYNRDGTQYLFLQPRPFMSNTVRELSTTKKHIQWMKESLRARGINVE